MTTSTVTRHLHEISTLLGPRPRAIVFADSRLLCAPGLRELAAACGIDTIHSRRSWTSLADADEVGGLAAGAEWVIAYGGGSVLDCVKLGLALDDLVVVDAIAAAGPAGWVATTGGARQSRLVAVPTTGGRAAETSGLATFGHAGRTRVLASPLLRPDVALLHAPALRSLNLWQLLDGGVEVLLRLLGGYVGDPDARPGADRAVLDLAAEVATWLVEVRQAAELSGPHWDQRRLDLLHWGHRSHDLDIVGARPAFADRSWPIALTLARTAGTSRVEALAEVVPRLWSLAPERPHLANAAHVERAWRTIRDTLPYAAAADPAIGLAQLLRWLGLEPLPISSALAGEVVAACEQQWGAGQPVLADLDADDLRHLVGPIGRTRAIGCVTGRRYRAAV